MFWPCISKQLEDKVSHCPICQEFRNAPSNEPLISHKINDILFNKIGEDLFEFENEHYYSKFPKIAHLNKLGDHNKLKEIFGRHSIPQTVISDNRPQFTSDMYRNFAIQYNFK